MVKVIQTNFRYRIPLIPLDLDRVNYIVVHHPAWKNVNPDEIHTDVLTDPSKKDWAGFPYNEYIRKDGTAYIGRGDFIGAQCAGYNSISYGICCEGDYDTEVIMPEIQKQALIERIKYNKARFPNYRFTVPHSRFSETSCPGKWFPMAEILKGVETVNLSFDDALKVLLNKGIINSPDYWCNYKDEYVKVLIRNMVKYINK